jgi:hypothetical protein
VMAGLNTTEQVQLSSLLKRLALHLESMLEKTDHAGI